MECYFENTNEFKKLQSQITETNEYDTLNIDKVPKELQIKFICKNNPKVLHIRNVNDLFYIIINSVSNIKVDYGEQEVAGETVRYGYDTQSQARDPIINYEFTKKQINYIREQRKDLLCSNDVKNIIKNYSSLDKDKVKTFIESHKVNCNELIINSIYCKSEKKNNFIWDLLQICKTIDKYTLIFAVEQGLSPQIVEFLLRFYKNHAQSCGGVNIMNEKGENVYNISKQNGTFIKYKNIFKKFKFKTPLILRSDEYKLIIKLINNGVNINITNKSKTSPLLLAIAEGHIETAKELIKAGAYIEQQTVDLTTAILLASDRGHLEIVKELIKAGANINHEDKDGDTSLIFSSNVGHINIVKELIKAGAKINHQNKNRDTALLLASLENKIEIVKELIKAGAKPDIQDKDGIAPLRFASENNYLEIVKALIKVGAKPNIQDNKGHTPLILASSLCYIEDIKELLKAGANPNIQDNRKDFAFIFIPNECFIEVSLLLINAKAKANLNIQDKDGDTILMLQINSGNFDNVKLLLQSGANPNIKNNRNITPLKLAQLKNNIKLVELLKNYGAK